jgi:hypothetical protein
MRLAHGGGRVFNSWFALTFQAAQLGWEAQNVVALRFVRLAGGGAAGAKEAQLMVTDKLAALEAQLAAVANVLTGDGLKIADKILRVFRKRVRANKRRLSRRRRLSAGA